MPNRNEILKKVEVIKQSPETETESWGAFILALPGWVNYKGEQARGFGRTFDEAVDFLMGQKLHPAE